MNKKVFNQHIRNFDFVHLFNELGWDYLNENTTRKYEDENFDFHSIAHKEGFRIIVCQAIDSGKVPSYTLRRKIQTEISKLYHENLLIFIDRHKSEQTWQLIDRKPNKPNQFRQTTWKAHQDPELLYQRMKGAFFTLAEQEELTIVDVTHRLRQNFTANAEKVTKQFYDKFKNEHKRFLGFIDGISTQGDREWYASLMLNRLMFCYFIQKKGFLNDDIHYLRNKLRETRDKQGKDRFYSFYKNFLLILFHKGLGSPHADSSLPSLGRVPYLNGGLFDVHELEKTYTNIEVKDEAFEKIFDFFDEYNWHLDDSPTATGRDINPDVIGYIFEKYINDRAQMGAYYTREDITDYISKNCIIPYLFDEVKRNNAAAMKEGAETWNMLKESGDKYIYGAVRHGVPQNGDLFGDLPPEIKAGFNKELAEKPVDDSTSPHLYELRKEWNKPAPADIALPTEIYREVIERRNRYREVKVKIETGDVKEINDFITYNLDIKQFAQDVLENTTDPALIRHFYAALKKVTILDPTCGSGAFLFAAMNILETLYRKCIDRMESFVEEEGKGKHSIFEKELAQVHRPEHPNLDYFIYKSIILNNLYGVDIMNEAVEIAKLRLFLKLMATVDPDYSKPNLGMEPLPDVDFNIRCGNTLVGFATGDELKKGLDYTFDGAIARPIIEEKCEVVARAFKRYKEIQLDYGDDYQGFREAKEELKKRLKELNKELNELLHMQYSGAKYDDWLKSYQPFHWVAEYYEIIEENKGFDVIIGNPPYVEYSKVKNDYSINQGYRTYNCGNLYAFVLENVEKFNNAFGRSGFIVPLSAFCTQRMEPLVKFYSQQRCDKWISHYGWRPATLFEGVNIPLSIIIKSSRNSESDHNHSFITEYYKWYREKRTMLFSDILYTDGSSLEYHSFVIPKIGKQYSIILEKTISIKPIGHLDKNNSSNYKLFYRNTGGLYWRIITDFKPYFEVNGHQEDSSTLNELSFRNESALKIMVATLNSNLFWVFYVAYSSFHHVNPIDLITFPINLDQLSDYHKNNLSLLCDQLMIDLKKNSKKQLRIHKGGKNSIAQTFYPSLSKDYVDKIDIQLANYYQFNQEELDIIINYDIQFRIQNINEDENEK